jgi:hypothetical protein
MTSDAHRRERYRAPIKCLLRPHQDTSVPYARSVIGSTFSSRLCRMKRARSPSEASASSSDLSHRGSPDPPIKYRRTDLLPQSTDSKLSCQLPPTCSDAPNEFATSQELQAHYERCHSHICQAEDCHKAFPDARFLELVSTVKQAFYGVEAYALLKKLIGAS